MKCDEEKPSCGYCKKKGIPCDYSKKLQWGGRPFKDNRIVKSMRFENTYVVEGICAIDLKTSEKSVKREKKKEKKNITSVYEENAPQVFQSFLNDANNNDLSVAEENLVLLKNSQTISRQVKDIPDTASSTEMIAFSPLSPFSSPNIETSLFEELQFPAHIMDPANQSYHSNNTFQPIQSLFDLHLPSLLPEPLLESPELAESFAFFLQETSQMLVPAPKSIYSRNPLFNFLPRMAMNNRALLNMLLVFGANHKHKILQHQGHANQSSSLVANDLLTNAFSSLLTQLTNCDSKNSDSTLATILLLAAFDIFFGDSKQKWRTHVYGARKIMKQRLSNGSKALVLSDNSADNDQQYFLLRWFAYIDIISSLSSTNSITNIQKLSTLKYEMETTVYSNLRPKKMCLQDIDYFTGMEVSCLWMLAEVSHIVNEKESETSKQLPHKLVLKTLELDHKIITYLRTSEMERDEVYETYYKLKTDSQTREQYQAYRTLRATNQIYALTGVLQLKRRVLGLPPTSPIVKEVLINITKLLREWIGFESSAETCVLFSIFCCGCELMDPDLVYCRSLYQDHFNSLIRKGVSSAKKAKEIMEECWLEEKQWWDIFREKNLDIAFAL